ncbi:hypothetical protein GOBAR_AA02910 [Gossypium barbadense]|uniref:EndoU domain-containing protein n=1 Tax=Gossypium barbadense TaxID=3634 RepID=A0A2P5YQ05_GOSBA|nr:hypothetical protein GOBAR_AA02910 [Gossypium barbadense]
MDGLIKGLLDVAIGHEGHNESQDERPRSSSAQAVSGDQDHQRDERSRSSWAQVVSGDQDHEKQVFRLFDEYCLLYLKLEHVEVMVQSQWQGSGSRPSGRTHKEQGEENNDGWETVGKKPRRRPQKFFSPIFLTIINFVRASLGSNVNLILGNWKVMDPSSGKAGKCCVNMDHWQGYKRPPSEQEYSDEVGTGTSIEPSEEELADFLQACNRLWQLDLNRLEPGKDYQIDCGEGKKVFQKEDVAEGSLFCYVNEDIFRTKPTFARFCSLLDNYNPNAGCKEVVTSEEKQEQAAFIEEISRTAPIQYLHKYLSRKGIVSENYQDFKRMLTSLWFDLYGRGGTSGSSSAFEHVFVGEIKQHCEQEVSGFHNWLQFYLEEAKGCVDYHGYILPRRRGETPDSETQLLTVQFEWNGVLKSVSSTLVGVSPEFEIALYTLCFFVGGEDNYVQLGPYSVNIKCYRFGNKIGSVFPIAE